MATLKWEQIVEETKDNAKEALLVLLEDADFPATSYQKFSVPWGLLELKAGFWAKLSQIPAALKTFFYNETARETALTKFAASHYANTRAPAVNATRRDTLSCSAAEGPHSIGLGAVVITDSDGKATFRVIDDPSAPAVWPQTLASGGTLDLLFEAEVAGIAANLPDGTVTEIVTTLAGVTVTSDALESEGVEEESDPRLRERNSLKWALLTKYELIDEAVRALVLNAFPAIRQVEVDSSNPRGAGTFDVYLSGETQTAGAPDVALAEALLQQYVFGPTSGALQTVKTFAAPETTLAVTGVVYYSGSYSESDVRTAVEGDGLAIIGSLHEYIRAIPIGGVRYQPGPSFQVPLNDLEFAIKAAKIGETQPVKTVVLSSPVANVAVAHYGKVVSGPSDINLTYIKV